MSAETIHDAIKTIMTGYTTHDTYLDKIPGQVHLCELFQHDDDKKLNLRVTKTRRPIFAIHWNSHERSQLKP